MRDKGGREIIKRYRKKPVEVEAVLLTEKNLEEVEDWIIFSTGKASSCVADKEKGELNIFTLEGVMTARAGEHYVVRGVKGEFYPVQKEIFEKTYEEAVG